MRRLAVPCLLPLLVAACGPGDRPRTAVSDSTLRVDASTAPGTVALELWQLRPGVTLGEWKSLHPDEPVTGADSSAIARYFGDWCAASQRRTLAGPRAVVRTAFFYPPAATDLALPDSVPDLVRQCLLGLIWVSVTEADSMRAGRLADSIRVQLAEVYGHAVERPVSFFGSAFWSRVGVFRRDSVIGVSALRGPSIGAAHDTTGEPRVALAFAFRPIANIGIDSLAPTRGPYLPGDTVTLDAVVEFAGLDTALAAELLALGHDTAAAGREPAALIRPLTRWLAASAGLAAPRRAAALMAADLVLDRALCSHRLCDLGDHTARRPLEALGARFNASPLGGSWVYTRSWMNQARILDRDSRLGQSILLTQLEGAFDFSGTCAAGPEGFRRVIANGERYLERVPDSPIAADVHFLVGEAYRDIVALAHGAGDIYADSSQYGAEAAAAAANAISHYRAAMRAGPASPVARAAWRQAWWLKAGLEPRDVRWYCVYD